MNPELKRRCRKFERLKTSIPAISSHFEAVAISFELRDIVLDAIRHWTEPELRLAISKCAGEGEYAINTRESFVEEWVCLLFDTKKSDTPEPFGLEDYLKALIDIREVVCNE